MTPQETAAQEELREWLRQLSALQHWLREILVNLPGPPIGTANQEDDLDEEPDIATEIRSTGECVLADYLEPAFRDLDVASRYRPVVRRQLGTRREP
jgi:hypothetical protein